MNVKFGSQSMVYEKGVQLLPPKFQSYNFE